MFKMGLVSIHSFLVKRMTAVAEEIFDAVKDNMIEYEQEIERLKQENCCLRSTLTHSRNGVCAETRNDTRRDGCLQVPLGSELSEIQVKMEVATVMPHDPLRQASTNISPLSEGFKRQEPSHCLTLGLTPNMLSKNEDIGGTDTQSSITFGADTQSSLTVKPELCENPAKHSYPSAVQSGSDCNVELPAPEQDLSCLQLYIENSDEMSQKAIQSHQNTLMCKICRKIFSTKGHLQRHTLVHQNQTPFRCGSCGSRFKSKFHLKEHEKLHAERRAEDRSEEPLDSQISHVEIILQPDCVNVDTNQRHSPKFIFSDQGPGKYPFNCKICDRPFKRQKSMKSHMLLHKGDRNYPCKFCGRRFYKSWHLTEHLRIHTGEKPFGCNKCGKGFVQWNQARSHIIKHHEGDMSLLSKEKA